MSAQLAHVVTLSPALRAVSRRADHPMHGLSADWGALRKHLDAVTTDDDDAAESDEADEVISHDEAL